jgi:bifunctional non-homologous end joining protein LigD
MRKNTASKKTSGLPKSTKKLPVKKTAHKKTSRVKVLADSSEEEPDLVLQLRREQGAIKTAVPASIEPMQATRITEPFDSKDYFYEVKWDGYRIIGKTENGRSRLYSRKGLDYTSKYPPVAEALSELPYDAVIDGEVVVFDDEGKPSFDRLQRYREGDPIAYYVFDLLWLEGYSLMKISLLHRRKMLEKIISGSGIKLSDCFDDGIALFNHVKDLDLEGIVAKEKSSIYEPGKRVKTWYKIPTEIRQEFVIGGWTESESARSFRSLLFGYFSDGKFIYAGHAGGGYKEAEMPKILSRLKKLEVKEKPFDGEVETDRDTHWIKPELVAEIKFATKTASGKIRKPAIFLGFREDKPAREVRKEITTIPETEKIDEPKPTKSSDKESSGSNWLILEKQQITSRSKVSFDGKSFELTNIEKELWGSFNKAHLLMYYHSILPYIMPHVKDRPLSLHIKHHGPTQKGLYIKDMEGRQPEWAKVLSTTRKHPKNGARNIIDYLVCQDEATLQYIINLGCIDVNPWSSRISSPENPDWISIDLDLPEGELAKEDFLMAVETTQATKEILDRYKIEAFPKTSGKTGIHIYIPCTGFDFKQARTIAVNICEQVHTAVPSITTTVRGKDARGHKVYVDPSQNDYADTLAAPYSARPNKLPTVSTPLEWREIKANLHPTDFTVTTILARLKKKGDLFHDVLSEKIKKSNKLSLRHFL